jgi:hypothetical protein
MVRRLKPSYRLARVKPTVVMRLNGASGSQLLRELGQIYWTQKGPDKAGKGRIFRASTEIPNGESAAKRTDIEVLFDNLPEPIDLDLDLNRRMLYWMDRGDPPRGNTVNRALMDIDLNNKKRQAPEILLTHLMEGIGIALDLKGERMFLTDLGGSVYSANINGSDKKTLLYSQGNLTGVAYVELPLLKNNVQGYTYELGLLNSNETLFLITLQKSWFIIIIIVVVFVVASSPDSSLCFCSSFPP